MYANWTDEDLIEEEMLKDASSDFICRWLESNGDTDLEKFYEYPSYDALHEKYEPIWSSAGEDKLTILVCRYGRDLTTLKVLFNSDLPKHFKIAVLKNYAFVRDAGLYELTHHGLTQSDVLNLYKEHTQDPDNRLFFELFLNPAIPEEFIERVFRKEQLYKDISDEHLLEIFNILFYSERENFFARKAKVYDRNSFHKDNARSLANTLINFIPTIGKIGKNTGLTEFCDWGHSSSIKNFIESSKSLDTHGIADEKTLLLFNDQPDDENKSKDAQDLISIQLTLGNRAFSGYRSGGTADQLLKLAESDYPRLRTIYYQNANLAQIYNLDHWKLKRFFADISLECIDWAVNQEGEPPQSLPAENQKAIGSMARLLKKDEAKFAACLAMNEEHYESKTSRNFLREICRWGDILGNTFHWPLGDGTCLDIYKAKRLEIKEKHPEYFDDETHLAAITEKFDDLKKQVLDVSLSFEKYTNGQSSVNKSTDHKLDLINQKLSEQQHQLDKIDAHISEFSQFFEQKIKEPTDVVSRLLFGIPILGRIFKAFFR